MSVITAVSWGVGWWFATIGGADKVPLFMAVNKVAAAHGFTVTFDGPLPLEEVPASAGESSVQQLLNLVEASGYSWAGRLNRNGKQLQVLMVIHRVKPRAGPREQLLPAISPEELAAAAESKRALEAVMDSAAQSQSADQSETERQAGKCQSGDQLQKPPNS